jgi:hypothetical protein
VAGEFLDITEGHAGDASGFHRRGEVFDVVFGEELGELRLERRDGAEVFEVGEFERVDVPVVVFGEDEEVDEPDGAGFDKGQELVGYFAVEGALTGGELDDDKSTGPSSSSVASVMVRPFVAVVDGVVSCPAGTRRWS